MLDISSMKTTELASLTLLDLTDLLIQDVKLGKMEFAQFALIVGPLTQMEFVNKFPIHAKLMMVSNALVAGVDMFLIMVPVNLTLQTSMQFLQMQDVMIGIGQINNVNHVLLTGSSIQTMSVFQLILFVRLMTMLMVTA